MEKGTTLPYAKDERRAGGDRELWGLAATVSTGTIGGAAQPTLHSETPVMDSIRKREIEKIISKQMLEFGA